MFTFETITKMWKQNYLQTNKTVFQYDADRPLTNRTCFSDHQMSLPVREAERGLRTGGLYSEIQ